MGTMLFVVLLCIYVLILVNQIVKRRNYFSSSTYILLGIFVPVIFYLLKWSLLINDEPTGMFFWIYISLMLFSTLSLVSTKRPVGLSGTLVVKRSKMQVVLVNAVWIAITLLNYKITSGYFFPSLSGVDKHVHNAQILVYFTRSTYVVVALDILYFCYKAEKKFLILGLLHILLPVFGASSRMQSTEIIVCAGSLLVFMWINGFVKKRRGDYVKEKKFGLPQKIIIVLILVGLGYWFIQAGIYRAGKFGTYRILYSKGIAYTGPGGEVGAWLYGYFALPSNNLNRSIIARNEKPNFIGLYSFPSLYFGVLRLGNILGLKSGAAQVASNYASGESTVPTGLWTFYYDYYVLCFIPYIVAFLKEYWLRCKVSFSKRKVAWLVLYFYYIPEWFFMNFTNTIFNDTAIITGIIGYLLINFFVSVDNSTV